MQLIYTETKLGTKFNAKDKTKEEHHHDLTYSVKYPVKNKTMQSRDVSRTRLNVCGGDFCARSADLSRWLLREDLRLECFTDF